jgi:uncharacterized repeat protein (TIGR01451 family)
MSRNSARPLSLDVESSRLLIVLLTTIVALLAGSVTAAQAAGPELAVTVAHTPDPLQRGDVGSLYAGGTGARFVVTVTNAGDADTTGPITIADTVPAGVKVRELGGNVISCSTTPQQINAGGPASCTLSSLAVGESQALTIGLVIQADAPDSVTNIATASGGGSVASASGSDTAFVVDRPAFGVTGFTARSLDVNGNDSTVAGGHPYEATASFSFPSYSAANTRYPVEDVKDIFTELPPGFVGNAGAAPRCELTRVQTAFPSCPLGSRVGDLTLTVGDQVTQSAIYNMVPELGYPAEFAFKFFNNSVVMYPQVRPRTGQYGLTVTVPGAARLGVSGIQLTFYGIPSERNGAGGPSVPFLSNPSDCLVAQPRTRIIVDSWQQPGRKLDDGFPDLSDDRWKTATAPAPPVTGCDAPELSAQFAPTMTAGPTPSTGTSQADAPSGYKVDLTFPQSNDVTDPAATFDPAILAAPQLKDATVTLPEGVAISPSGASGLDGCSDLASAPEGDRVRIDSTVPVTCPSASKIGTVVGTSPLLAEHDSDTDEVIGAQVIQGDIYLVKPHPGDLSPAGNQDGTFRLLIQLESEKDGLNVKLPGVVTADRVTGRLTARFDDNPELPVKTLSLTFKGGDRASLVNPATCAVAKTTGVFTPWSRGGTRSDGLEVLGTPDVTASSVFDVSWDGKGAACPATLPFAPTMAAGTTDQQAGGSSPFTFDLNAREDREDIASGLTVTLPGGVLGSVRDVPLCSDADADAGTCPAASRVGTAAAAAGAGGSPFYLSGQPVSLTGPYKGAPYGLAIAVHAVAGPFDLGTVVVRQALYVNADDAHLTVVSDPFPTIRDGVPLRLRRVHVTVDRPGFMRSPTSCEPKAIGADVSSVTGQTVALSTPFQMVNCNKVRFKPRLAMRLTGASETKVGGHPGVEALVTQQPGEAGLKSATVTLPLSLALDPNNAVSDDLCEFGDGLKDQCPEKSVIGTVTAVSPLLKAPLNGKVFFVKGLRADPKSGRLIRTLPTLLVELRGEIDVNLRAVTSVPDGKHLVTTFPMVPDAPISSFFLRLNGGPHGILVATDGGDVCGEPQAPFFVAVGQNGKRVDTATTLAAECPLALSRTFTSSTVRVRVTGIGAGTVTVSGTGVQTTRRTIASATSATVTAKLTAKGKRMRKAGQDVRVKVSFVAKGTKKAAVAFSVKAKVSKKKA